MVNNRTFLKYCSHQYWLGSINYYALHFPLALSSAWSIKWDGLAWSAKAPNVLSPPPDELNFSSKTEGAGALHSGLFLPPGTTVP